MPSRLAQTRPPSAASYGQAPEATHEVTRSEPVACAYCLGTGMEVVAGRGARRRRCRAQELWEGSAYVEARRGDVTQILRRHPEQAGGHLR